MVKSTFLTMCQTRTVLFGFLKPQTTFARINYLCNTGKPSYMHWQYKEALIGFFPNRQNRHPPRQQISQVCFFYICNLDIFVMKHWQIQIKIQIQMKTHENKSKLRRATTPTDKTMIHWCSKIFWRQIQNKSKLVVHSLSIIREVLMSIFIAL